jgi:ATP-dependent DNA helicase DinG
VADSASAQKITVLDVLGNDGLFSRHLPNYEARPQQVAFATLIEQGIADRQHVVGELGTGGGKSFAGLVPAVLSGEKVVYATYMKSLQEQIGQKDAPFLAQVFTEEIGRPVRYAVLKGRGNYTCLRNMEELEQGGGFRSPQAATAFEPFADWVHAQREDEGLGDVETYPGALPTDLRLSVVTGTDECTGHRCRFYDRCFGERAKARAQAADIIIVNHRLLCLDAQIREESEAHAAVLPDHSLLIIDEAHNFSEVIRDTAGIEITPGRLNRLGWLLKKYTVDYDAVVEAASKPGEGDVANRVPVEQAEAQRWVDGQEAILVPLHAYLEALKLDLQGEPDSRERRLGDERPIPVGLSTLGDLVVQLLRFGQVMEGSSPFWLKGDDRDAWLKVADNTITLASEFLTVISPDAAGTWVRRAALDGEEGKLRVILEAKPIDVAPIGRRWFFSGIKREQLMRVAGGASVPISTQPPLTTISMSATIATNGDVAMYRARVGCTDAVTAVEGSPFDYKHHALLYLPGQPADLVPVQKRDRVAWEQYVQALCAEMRGLTLDAGGGAFLLFTSRSMLTEVHTRIAADLEDAGLLVLKQGEMSLRKTVELFKADGNAVLFGLKSYGEGVDVQGDALRLVVIDKVPFNPPTDLVWKALCDHLDRNGGNSFRDLSMPNAIITLKQFVGRLIRSTTDRGVMAILDGRVRTKFYGREILANLPPAPVTSDPQEIQRLYAAMQRARTAPVPAPVPPPVAVVVPTGPRSALRPGRLGQGRDAGVTRSARPAQ